MNKTANFLIVVLGLFCGAHPAIGIAEERTTYVQIKAALDAVHAIDTHSHLRPFRYFQEIATPQQGFALPGIWASGYPVGALPAWKPGGSFDDWWRAASPVFDDARAMSTYRYRLPAFRDLYGVDFDSLTLDQARRLSAQVEANYRSEKWVYQAVGRAKIERMLIDTFWTPLRCDRYYTFMVPVLRIDPLLWGSHPDQYTQGKFARYYVGKDASPYVFAAEHGLTVGNFDEYLALIDAVFHAAVERGAVSIKSAMAYLRTIRVENVPRARAERAFGKRPSELNPAEQRDFEDFIFWHVTKLAARYNLPFQIHTGWGKLEGSNPMLLVDLIEANPKTKFVLFHGGYPWVGETGAIAKRYSNVWIDSVWMPTIDYTMARRAYQEWLNAVPSSRMMWGSDTQTPEDTYGATELTRRCLAEALAEMVEHGELRQEQALRIGRQVLRENALALFPRLKSQPQNSREKP